MRVDIGPHTLFCGDAREIVGRVGPIDMLFSSPPYNCGKEYGAASDSLEMGDYSDLLADCLFPPQARICVVNVGQYIGSRSARQLFRDVLLATSDRPLVDEVIWDKGPANGAAWGNWPNSPRVRAQHESLYAFGDAKMPNGNGLDRAQWSRLTTSIWRIPAKVDLSVHPAMMPEELAKRAIMLWADSQGVVCDPFMGSGTTGVAAIHAGRKFVGIELDEGHFTTAQKRIEAAYSQQDLFEANHVA